MIDKKINHLYVITVNYWILNGEGKPKRQQETFTSNHSASSKRFTDFLNDHMKTVKGFWKYDEDQAEQRTIPLSMFCS